MKKAVSARSSTLVPRRGSAPTVRAVTRVSAISRAAPRAEFADPLRSRVPAMTGAVNGVEITPSRTFRPRTPV